MKKTLFAALTVIAVAATLQGQTLVWDGTKAPRLMSESEDIVLFKNARLSDYRLDRCWFNKARRIRVNGTLAMCNGRGTVCHPAVSAQADRLEAQCQIFDDGWTKCVKVRLSQKGNDVVGRVVYAKYCPVRNRDALGADFDVYTPSAAQPVYSILPSGRASDGYNVDWLTLREIGSADDNLPETTGGAMPEDEVMNWMERAVPPDVWAAYRAAHPAPFHLFGEDRRYAVRNNIRPAHWFAKSSQAGTRYTATAQPGEFFPFQVCVVSDTARTLVWRAETSLPVTCVTPSRCAVAARGVKPIWVLVEIPSDAAGKTVTGSVRVEDEQTRESRTLPFEIAVKGEVLADGGVSDAWRLSRLKWLESDVGREPTVTKPYEPVRVDAAARTVTILGRDLILGEDGLPQQIISRFNGSNTRLVEKGFPLLASPFTLTASGLGAPSAHRFAFTRETPAEASWRAETVFGRVTRIVEGRLDFTGSGFFRVRYTGGALPRVAFEARLPAETARYFEGFGRNGGAFTEGRWTSDWNPKFNRDAVWMGRVNGGLAIRFRGANYRRPLINAYYAWQPLLKPESWASGGGSLTVEKTSAGAVLRAEASNAPAGAEWNFELFLTPFRCLDLNAHLAERYHHFGQRQRAFNAAAVRASGATVVNLHHNTVWNPYINYPYNDDGGPLLKKAITDAHAAGLLLKIYYTTRELTQNLPEFFALKSLDGEALLTRDPSVPGWPCTNPRGPHPWLRLHVGTDILPAWRENVRFGAYPNRLDLAVITTPDTRWDNFYLAGLDYLVRTYGIDGIYIDDTALTGASMQRARRILDRDGKRRLVDNHSWNHHDARAGAGSTNLAFIDLYPYFDLLWRGEGFYNNTPPDFWLIERSGIAFGLPGEMLGRGHAFRGLLFGMTDRLGWGGDPRGLWKFFDETGLGSMELVGWWDEACPVTVSGAPDVKASVWKGTDGRAVLVLANFADKDQTATLSFDAARLGFDAKTAAWSRPAIARVQTAAPAPALGAPVAVPGGGGFILVASPSK
jgi:hypothetical protein